MSDGTTNRIRRPLKVVLHNEENYQAPLANGGERKIFDQDTVEQTRANLQDLFSGITSRFGERFLNTAGARGVARVILKSNARAKSYRPVSLFKDKTCPIIGCDEAGTLLIGVSKEGAEKLVRRLDNHSKIVTAAISTIKKIEPYVATPPEWNDQFTKGVPLKLRLFNHGDEKFNAFLKAQFLKLASEKEMELPEELDYAKNLLMYKVRCHTPEQLVALSGFYGTQSVSRFVEFGDYREGHVNFAGTSSISVPPVDDTAPIVGLLDTGVSPLIPGLSNWIVGRDEDDVPEVDRDYGHGTFIAGLLVASRDLNDGNQGFPRESCRIFDAIVMPKGGTNEELLLNSIKRVVRKHPEIRVWNLSANIKDTSCSLDSFSHFAMALDELQEECKCIITCSAGNCSPRKSLPIDPNTQDDRVSPPAENVLGVTVGSVAHIASSSSLVKSGKPSPFSRRGPASGYIQKPDVCHYGGNCDALGNDMGVGVKSFFTDGRICYGVGTSYAAPLVSIILAHLMANDGMSPNLAKALLIHSAILNTKQISKGNFNYIGYGVPGPLDSITSCEPWAATLIFETTMLPSRRRYDHTNFPIPKCLMQGNGFCGEITMTLVCNPMLNSNDGAEYCRSNVDASIGVRANPNSDGYIGQKREIEPIPRSLLQLYERDLIAAGKKWNPVKAYRQRCNELPITGDWGVRLDVTYRDLDEVDMIPQDFALVVTISDPEKIAPVYDTVQAMLNVNAKWQVKDLQITNQLSQRTVVS